MAECNQPLIGSLLELSQFVKVLLVPVNEQGEAICDYKQYHGSKDQLSKYLGGSTDFSQISEYISSNAPIKIIPFYPDDNLYSNKQMKRMGMALLVFELSDTNDCPKVLHVFSFQSFVGQKKSFDEKILQYQPERNKWQALGHGAFGTVYQVSNQHGQNYAIKVVDINKYCQVYSTIPQVAKAKIANEVAMQQKVDSPNVIKVIEQFSNDDTFCIVLELATQSLQKYLEQKKARSEPLTTSELVSFMTQICQGVKDTHDHGVMHRDLKPDNVMLTPDDKLKLIDFGFAREGDAGSSILGTKSYCAPEVMSGEGYTKAVDIYSLGCILYFMMTYELYVMQSAVQGAKPKLENKLYQQEIIGLCQRMLSKDAGQRPDIDAVLQTIAKINSGQLYIRSDESIMERKQKEYVIQLPPDFEFCQENKFVMRLQKITSDFEMKNHNNVIKKSVALMELIEQCDDDPDQNNEQILACAQILLITSQISLNNQLYSNEQIELLREAFTKAKWRHMMFYIITNQLIAKEAFVNTLKQRVYQNADNELFFSKQASLGQIKPQQNASPTIVTQTLQESTLGKSSNSLQQVISKRIEKPIKYEARPIKDMAEFDELMLKSQQTQKQLQTFIDDLIKKAADQNKNRPADRQIDPDIFKQICQNIILNHLHWGNDVDAIRSDIQYVFDNYSIKNSTDGTHYGDNTTQKQVQFQKHVAKYPGGDLKVYDSKGQCIFNYVDDDTFVYPFISGQQFGIALYIRINGEQCTCVCKANKKFGFGQYKWTKGDIYEGDFAADVRTGRGKIQFASGNIYEGDWKDDKMTGKGAYKFASGDIYEGDFKNGDYNGYGIYKDFNGDVYTGNWKDDKKNGQGKLVKKNGEIQQGIWDNGSLVKKE